MTTGGAAPETSVPPAAEPETGGPVGPQAAGSPSGARPDDALAGWMEAHGPELRAHLARMLERPDDAEDVLQEVWLTAHRAPPTDGDADANVRAWLYRVATHAALDRLAKERRRAGLLAARGHELAGEGSAPPPPDAGLAEADRDAIRRRVSALPHRQRDAVWLRWLEGEPYETVAEKLGCSRAAARANVYQGLKRLRRELAPYWGAGNDWSEEIDR